MSDQLELSINISKPIRAQDLHLSHCRSVTVSAVGQLGLASHGGVFEDLVSHMAQRVFDPSPAVRMKHIQVR